jgi:hypothetical protein
LVMVKFQLCKEENDTYFLTSDPFFFKNPIWC